MLSPKFEHVNNSCVIVLAAVRARRPAIQSRTRYVRRKVEITEHRCQWCGSWFETRRSDARYCRDRTMAAISEWPNRTTRDAAAEFIERVRREVRTEDHSRMTGEMLGEVVAEV